MLNATIETAKSRFFDRAPIDRVVDRQTKKAFSKFGAYVRRKAKGLIRKVGKKGASARPGQPPKSRTGLLKDHIYFAYDPTNKSVVIGPARLENLDRGQSRRTPGLLERGGYVTRLMQRRMKDGQLRRWQQRAHYEPHHMAPAFRDSFTKLKDELSGYLNR